MQWVDSERSSPVVSLGLCIVLTLFIFGVGALVTAKLYSGVQRLTSTELRLGELNGVIVHHDEVLTMSAYMAAQTGETKWEDRYRRYEVPLEAAIKEMQATVPGAVAEHATQKTDAANHALIEMENRVFSLVRQNDKEGAAKVFDAHYEKQKQIYADGIREAMRAARQRIAEQLEARVVWSKQLAWSAVLVLLGLVAVWARLFILARRYVRARARAEADLKASHETLESRVTERTHDLQVANAQLGDANAQLNTSLQREREAHDQLLQAGKLAAVGQLAAGISLEINNPLAVILGFAQGLERRVAASDPNRVPVLSIVREALRCKTLVQELLTFSRTAKTTVEKVDLNALVSSSMVLLEARARTQGIEVTTELHPAGVLVEANKIQLQQVIINLGTNAFDAMSSGGTLTVRTHGDAQQVVLEVQDTGSGIPEEVRARIFEPFFSTKEVGKGTGLGLSLVHEIVQQHKGSIEVKSELNCGTILRIVLPAREAKKVAA